MSGLTLLRKLACEKRAVNRSWNPLGPVRDAWKGMNAPAKAGTLLGGLGLPAAAIPLGFGLSGPKGKPGAPAMPAAPMAPGLPEPPAVAEVPKTNPAAPMAPGLPEPPAVAEVPKTNPGVQQPGFLERWKYPLMIGGGGAAALAAYLATRRKRRRRADLDLD